MNFVVLCATHEAGPSCAQHLAHLTWLPEALPPPPSGFSYIALGTVLQQDFGNPSRRLKLCSLTNASAALPAPSLRFTFPFSLNCLLSCGRMKDVLLTRPHFDKSHDNNTTIWDVILKSLSKVSFSCNFNQASLHIRFDSAMHLKLCS